jgi:ATP-dependent helicase HepA
VDERGSEARKSFPGHLEDGDAHPLLSEPGLREELIPNLLQRSQEIAASEVGSLIDNARHAMNSQLEYEIKRLTELKKVNRTVRAEEIDLLAEQQNALDVHLKGARLRLDAIRLIQRGRP